MTDAQGDVMLDRIRSLSMVLFVPGLVALAAFGCESAPHAKPDDATVVVAPSAAPAKVNPDTPHLYTGFGNYSRDITTNSPEAQTWFNQGMQLLYGFNHDEAIRSFTEAARLDPDCAMAWWGVSYAHGLHINNPVMTAQ